jgi:chondroitin 4-sulfotransferase 11
MAMLKKLNYWFESKRIDDRPSRKALVSVKDTVYIPVHYLCEIGLFRKIFFHLFGTTGRYEPGNRGIISHKKRFIYFYIPKVASTTIKRGIAKALFGRSIGAGVHRFWFDEVVDIKKGEYEDHFKFSFVRNPWDRVISCYSDKILHENVTNHQYINGVFRRYVSKYKDLFYMGMTFEDFVRVISKIPDTQADRHFRSQRCFITDQDGNDLTDFVGRFENLRSDLAFVARRTGLGPFKLYHENKSTRPSDYRRMYTEGTKRLIAERYKDDIERFDYRF